MKSAFQNLKCFDKNEDEFNFIKYINKITKKIESEGKWNIEALKKKSLKLGKKGLILPLFEESNQQFYNINEGIESMKKEVQKFFNELMKKIMNTENNDLNVIFDESFPSFKDLIKSLFLQKIENKDLDIIMKEMKNILNQKLVKANENFDKKYFIKSFEPKFIDKKEDFINNCKDYILESITNNVSKYAIFSLFFIFGTIVIDYSIKKLNDIIIDKKRKLIKLFKEYQKEIYNSFKNTILMNQIK